MEAFNFNNNKQIQGFNYNVVNRMKSSDKKMSLSSLFGMGNVTQNNNKIKFWTEVNDDSCKELLESCMEVEKKLLEFGLHYNIPQSSLPPIELYINSPGGSVHSALAVVDHIQSSKFKYVSIIEGCAASAATLISTVCDERKITHNGMMLIHELSSCNYGKMFEMEDSMNSLRKLMEIIYTIYRENTRVNLHDLKKILQHDIFWTAEEALEFGIVDEIIQRTKRPRYENNRHTFRISDNELRQGALKLEKNKKQNKHPLNFMDLFNVINMPEDSKNENVTDKESTETDDNESSKKRRKRVRT